MKKEQSAQGGPTWEQVEEEREDYQYFHGKQQEENKRIIEEVRSHGFIQGYTLY